MVKINTQKVNPVFCTLMERVEQMKTDFLFCIAK